VEACACPREAELRLAAATIALIDLSSRAVDGVNLIRTLSKRRPDLPIVALGSRADSPGAIAAIRAGARGCLFVDDTSHRLLLAMDEASAGGRPMSRGMGALLFDHVHGGGRRPSSSQRLKALRILTERERAVLQQLARGLVYEDVGRTLGISVNTVRSFVRSIYEKLSANSRTEAVLAGIRLGLVAATPPPDTSRR
jgi:DNA-binding NarL/FixJ family response regulator